MIYARSCGAMRIRSRAEAPKEQATLEYDPVRSGGEGARCTSGERAKYDPVRSGGDVVLEGRRA